MNINLTSNFFLEKTYTDQRLKFKLKICDKDNGKFRSEYLDKDGNVINDPDLDYD